MIPITHWVRLPLKDYSNLIESSDEMVLTAPSDSVWLVSNMSTVSLYFSFSHSLRRKKI